MSIYETMYRVPDTKYCNDCDTFLTVTLSPTMFGYNMREQHRKTFLKIVKFLDQFFKTYFLVVELTKEANIHYHIQGDMFENCVTLEDGTKGENIAIIQFKDVYKTLCKFGFGFHKLETVKNKVLTAQYLRKDLSKTQMAINRKNKAYLPIWHYKAIAANDTYNVEVAHIVAKKTTGKIAERLDQLVTTPVLRMVAQQCSNKMAEEYAVDMGILFDDPFKNVTHRARKPPIPDTDKMF